MLPQYLAALRSRDFRLYWTGFVVSVSGQQMQWMLEPWLIYELTGSKVLLGVNALAQAIPATALVLLGGVIADKFDQRKLLIGVQAAYLSLIGALAALAFSGRLEVWHILVVAFVQSAVGSFENPARQSMFPHLVSREAMPNAVALNAAVHPATRIGAPVLGGLILAQVLAATGSPRLAAGTVWLMAMAGVATYALLLAAVRLPPVPRARGGSVVSDMAAGARFVWRNPVFALLIGMAYYHMFFGISISVLYPVIAKDVLQVGPDALGMMWGAMGVGSLAGVTLAARFSAPRHQRAALVGGQLLLATAMIGFARAELYWLALGFLFLLGLGSSLFNVSVQQNLQMLVPNQLRGRVLGLWGIVHTSVRPLGEVQFSGIAAAVAAPFAVTFGAVMLLASALALGLYRPPLRRLVELREAAEAQPIERRR